MFASKLMPFLFAGIWFAVAAGIPIVYVFVRFQTVAFPILLSLICGSLIGLTILDSKETKA